MNIISRDEAETLVRQHLNRARTVDHRDYCSGILETLRCFRDSGYGEFAYDGTNEVLDWRNIGSEFTVCHTLKFEIKPGDEERGMNIIEAMKLASKGEVVKRPPKDLGGEELPGTGYITVVHDPDYETTTAYETSINLSDKFTSRWEASLTDILSEDWEVVPGGIPKPLEPIYCAKCHQPLKPVGTA